MCNKSHFGWVLSSHCLPTSQSATINFEEEKHHRFAFNIIYKTAIHQQWQTDNIPWRMGLVPEELQSNSGRDKMNGWHVMLLDVCIQLMDFYDNFVFVFYLSQGMQMIVEIRIHILHGPPNSTEATQQLNQGYMVYNLFTWQSTVWVVVSKITWLVLFLEKLG